MRIIRNWHTINEEKWKMFRPPFRPSEDDIKNYFYYIKKSSSKNILILGATPELRDITAELKIKTFIMDYSVNMVLVMSRFLKIANPKNEIWIRSNWFNGTSNIGHFDMATGDLILRNVPLHVQDRFMKTISNMLIPNGCIVFRVHLLNKEIIEKDSTKIIKSIFKKNPVKKNISNKDLFIYKRDIEDLITSKLFDVNTNLKSKTTDKRRFFKNIRDYLKNNDLSEIQKSMLKNILKKWRTSVSWIQRDEKEIENLFKKYFIIENKKISDDYEDASYYPIYILKKKN